MEDKAKKPQVTVEVSGGVAEVTYNPHNIDVKIINHDNNDN